MRRRYFPLTALGGVVSSFSMTMVAVADLLPARHRATAAGYISASFSIGVLVGPLAGGLMSTLNAGVRTLVGLGVHGYVRANLKLGGCMGMASSWKAKAVKGLTIGMMCMLLKLPEGMNETSSISLPLTLSLWHARRLNSHLYLKHATPPCPPQPAPQSTPAWRLSVPPGSLCCCASPSQLPP